jgi:DNA-binding SARP family transcriptional activator
MEARSPDGPTPTVGRASLRLLGGWHLIDDDGRALALSSREQRLTALLGLVGERRRLHVAGTLWPESTDQRAMANLRRAVMATKQRRPGLLRADRVSIALADDVDVDVTALRRAASSANLPATDNEKARLLALLGTQELLPGWYDDWVLVAREALAQLRVGALERVARQALEAGDLGFAIAAARAITDVEPFAESACEVAISAHLARDDFGSAVHEFQRYSATIRHDLGVAPSGRILALIEPALTRSDDVPTAPVLPRQRTAPAAESLAFAPPSLSAVPPDEAPVGGTGRLLAALVAALVAVSLAFAMAGPGRGGQPSRGAATASRPTPTAVIGPSLSPAPTSTPSSPRSVATPSATVRPRPRHTPTSDPSPQSLPIQRVSQQPSPTQQPTAEPTQQPTPQPTQQPTRQPTNQPTKQTTHQPTHQPRDPGSVAPTPVG